MVVPCTLTVTSTRWCVRAAVAGEPVTRVTQDLGELNALGGLPSDLPLVDVAAVIGADPEAYVRWFLGDPPKETFWCPASAVEGFDQIKPVSVTALS